MDTRQEKAVMIKLSNMYRKTILRPRFPIDATFPMPHIATTTVKKITGPETAFKSLKNKSFTGCKMVLTTDACISGKRNRLPKTPKIIPAKIAVISDIAGFLSGCLSFKISVFLP